MPRESGEVMRLVLMLLAVLAGAATLVAQPAKGPAQPPAVPPRPGGSITIGGGGSAPPPAVNPDTAETDAVASTGLAPSEVATSRPATAPSFNVAWPDVSFNRNASTRPAPRPKPIPSIGVTDAQIDASIRSAMEVLIAQFDPRTGTLRGRRYAPNYEALECGLNALCVYALMQAGEATNDPRLRPHAPLMKAMIDGAKKLRADEGMHQTYARSLRALALSVHNREEDQAQLREDVGCLVFGNFSGGYGYLSAQPTSMSFRFTASVPPGFDPRWADNSNTQYGVLGVWSGAEAGIDVPPGYWRTAVEYWTKMQSPGGRWAYRPVRRPQSTEILRPADNLTRPSMTAAGTASLYVANEYVERETGFKCGRDPFGDPLRKALAWWEHGDNAVNLSGAKHWGYTLYGVERVGLASGFKFFGDHDWYRTLAAHAIGRQTPDGSWGDLVDTAYALVFLSRGRHPILFNKLRFDGRDEIQPDYWANRPNDVAFLSRFASKQLERTLNWQVVPLKKDWTDWLDSPVLQIASHARPRFQPADYDKLRKFVEAGGLIFCNSDRDEEEQDPLKRLAAGGSSAGSDAFDRFVTEMAAKLFPEYRLADVPSDHPVFSSVFKLSEKPKLRGVSNGSRLLLVHSRDDLSLKWQKRDEKKDRPAFEFGVNLFVYAAGRRDLRNRLDSPLVPAPPADHFAANAPTVAIARLKYAGNWSPEPAAWGRFANLLAWKTGVRATIADVAWKDLKPGGATIGHVTGAAAYKPTAAELAATRAFVNAGGVLLVDSCGGGSAWPAAIEQALGPALPGAVRSSVEAGHPILAGAEPGMTADLKPAFRQWSTERVGVKGIRPPTVWKVGKGAVVLCPFDLTTGLLGANTWGVHGYEPATAEAFVRNVALWALDGRP